MYKISSRPRNMNMKSPNYTISTIIASNFISAIASQCYNDTEPDFAEHWQLENAHATELILKVTARHDQTSGS